ncbi:NADPH:quinone oxidoreductase family protein, partial [Blastococcus sp. CT_GayMR20]
MRAVLVHEFGSLERTGIQETADPVPAPGEVLVEIHAAPVNFVDLVTFRGEYQFRP